MPDNSQSEFASTADHADAWLKGERNTDYTPATSRETLLEENVRLGGKLLAEYEALRGKAKETLVVFPHPIQEKDPRTGRLLSTFLAITSDGFRGIQVLEPKKEDLMPVQDAPGYIKSAIEARQKNLEEQKGVSITFGYDNGRLSGTLGAYGPRGKFSMGIGLDAIEPNKAESIIQVNRAKVSQSSSPTTA